MENTFNNLKISEKIDSVSNSYNDVKFIELDDVEKTKQPAILLIDASGSVKMEYNDGAGFTIFDHIEKLVKKIKADHFRVIFWNSNRPSNSSNFPNGIMRMMHAIEKNKISQPFYLVKNKIDSNCLTFPHLAFKFIPESWINNVEPTHIYFITDGNIGYVSCDQYVKNDLKNELKKEIEKLTKTNNNVHLHIITIENNNIDFTKSESLCLMAGGDVFKVIQDNNLTNNITEFTSYTPNNPNGFKHIGKIIYPSGHVPFGTKCFSELNTGKFISYLQLLISNSENEETLLKIIQNLSDTLKYLIKDKSPKMADDIINVFCFLFRDTEIDESVVNFVLKESISSDSDGKTLIYSQYRDKIKNYYKEINKLLQQNTKNMLGFGVVNNFISLPIGNKIITGKKNLIDAPITINKCTYQQSSVSMEDYRMIIPVLPFVTSDLLTDINEQSIRQFTRVIISRQYGVNQMEDIVVYIILYLNLKIMLSNLSSEYKLCYKRLALIMLGKKFINEDVTELERLKSGKLPISSDGNSEKFYLTMNKIGNIFNNKFKPMTMWYLLCCSLDDNMLVDKQYIHCRDSVKEDLEIKEIVIDDNIKNNDDVKNNLFKLLNNDNEYNIIEINNLDYQCIITLEDCSKEGGYIILPHTTISNLTCSPNFVISKSGFDTLQKQERNFCPICYQDLDIHRFSIVGPKVINLDESSSSENMFSKVEKYTFPSNISHLSFNSNTFHSESSNVNNSEILSGDKLSELPLKNKQIKTLIIMKGTVGSGKSTHANAIQKCIEEIGGYCINEGTDKYRKMGYSSQCAIEQVENKMREINNVKNNLLVVIIDTCGDKGGNNIFGHNFQNWKTIKHYPNFIKNDNNLFNGYLSWSLINVLNRKHSSQSTEYYLNPVDAGISTCVSVHTKKSIAVFGKNRTSTSVTFELNKCGIFNSERLERIKIMASKYEQHLNNNLKQELEVQKIVEQCL